MAKANEGLHLQNVPNMFEAAKLVGDAIRKVFERDAEHLKNQKTEFNANILLAGQIKGERPRLFNIYSAGNFIESCPETPYFQIGETKYGKPIIDRVVRANTDMMDVVKCVLISFDSTIRSNISVAAPIDLLLYRTDNFNAKDQHRISESDPYYASVRKGWGEGLKRVFSELPSPDWQ
jgi:putative proteasome-type protease